jgi:LDH2 family malate/lactate/ureidoglycolate dehydrogenase
MQIVSAEALRALVRALIVSVGTAPETAAVVGDSLVDANLAGTTRTARCGCCSTRAGRRGAG